MFEKNEILLFSILDNKATINCQNYDKKLPKEKLTDFYGEFS